MDAKSAGREETLGVDPIWRGHGELAKKINSKKEEHRVPALSMS